MGRLCWLKLRFVFDEHLKFEYLYGAPKESAVQVDAARSEHENLVSENRPRVVRGLKLDTSFWILFHMNWHRCLFLSHHIFTVCGSTTQHRVGTCQRLDQNQNMRTQCEYLLLLNPTQERHMEPPTPN